MLTVTCIYVSFFGQIYNYGISDLKSLKLPPNGYGELFVVIELQCNAFDALPKRSCLNMRAHTAHRNEVPAKAIIL